MGCDIHLYKEKKIDGVWVTADEGWEYDEFGILDIPWEQNYPGRDYDLYGFLSAGVRADHKYAFSARGIPFNACKNVVCANSIDGHSASYLGLSELKDAWEFLSDKTIKVEGMKEKSGLELLVASVQSDEDTNWDLLYPYCKYSNIIDNEEFCFDVPSRYMLGRLQFLIKLFDDIEAEDHRIVFWFDS